MARGVSSLPFGKENRNDDDRRDGQHVPSVLLGFPEIGPFPADADPYLWVIMVVLDGGSVTQSGTRLKYNPKVFLSQGSHGNLASMNPGDTITIPPNIGTFTTTLQPIQLIDTSGNVVQVPGQIAVLAVLTCEGGTPDDAVEAGHQALNQMVLTRIQQFVTGIDLLAVGAMVQEKITNNPAMSQQDAAIAVVADLFTPVQKDITQLHPLWSSRRSSTMAVWL